MWTLRKMQALSHQIALYEERLRCLGCHHPALDIVAQSTGDSLKTALALQKKLWRLRDEQEMLSLQQAETSLRERWADMDPYAQEASFIPDELSELAGLLQEIAQKVKHDEYNGA